MTRRPGPGRRRAGVVLSGVVLVLVLAGSVFTGCSAARTDVGTSDESCYMALPTAAHAVGPGAHFTGVRKYTTASLKGVAPRLYTFVAKSVPAKQSVCLAAYTGHFTSYTVVKPVGRAAGTIAVAVVRTPSNQLMGTLILTKVPVRFQHTLPF